MTNKIKFFPFLIMFLLLLLGGCKDECDSVNCLNGGTCDEGNCNCTSGFEGDLCQTATRDKFFGTYNVNESCDFGNDTYQMVVTASGAGPNRILLNNFFNIGVIATGTVSGNSVNLPSQTANVQGQSWTFNGSGQIVGSVLTLSFTASVGNASGNCTATSTKL